MQRDVAGLRVQPGGALQQFAGDGGVGRAPARQREEFPRGGILYALPAHGEGCRQAQVVAGGIALGRAPALHREVGQHGVQLLQVGGDGQAREDGQVAAGEFQRQRQPAEALVQGVEGVVGIAALPGEVSLQESAALLQREAVQRQQMEAQVGGPGGAAGGDQHAAGCLAQLRDPGAGGRGVFQVVEDHQAGAARPPHFQRERELFGQGLWPGGEVHGQPAHGHFRIEQAWLLRVDPVDAMEEASIAVGELHRELRLAHPAHALDRLRHQGGVSGAGGWGRRESLRQGAEICLAPGEEGVAGEGHPRAGRQRAGRGEFAAVWQGGGDIRFAAGGRQHTVINADIAVDVPADAQAMISRRNAGFLGHCCAPSKMAPNEHEFHE
ncbi:MAG: hypothetical protein BWY25_01441 [Chloroflexi bacterium ADurb.Bin222]|nr:MAG: hypothetical protein BWY25_01441 [Chloroflexi bacterium ADurb.Bin222]